MTRNRQRGYGRIAKRQQNLRRLTENKLKRNGEPKILYDLEIWMDKDNVIKVATKFEKIHLEQT